jgi:ABC-type dipeptide/oligopeptide/nickel transport system ATPase component
LIEGIEHILSDARGSRLASPKGIEQITDVMAQCPRVGLRSPKFELLAIARAALVNPRTPILDKVTRAVDTRSAIQLHAGLHWADQDCFSFVIAHRLSAIRNAELVLVIKDGRIVERGTHDSLLAPGDSYQQHLMSQFARADSGPRDPGAAGLARPPASVGPPEADELPAAPRVRTPRVPVPFESLCSWQVF